MNSREDLSSRKIRLGTWRFQLVISTACNIVLIVRYPRRRFVYLKGKIHLISTRCMYRYILGTVFKIRSNVWHWQAYWCLKSVTETMNEWTKTNGGSIRIFSSLRGGRNVKFQSWTEPKFSSHLFYTLSLKRVIQGIVKHSSNITKVCVFYLLSSEENFRWRMIY